MVEDLFKNMTSLKYFIDKQDLQQVKHIIRLSGIPLNVVNRKII